MKKFILLSLTFGILFSGCALVLGENVQKTNKYQQKRDELRMNPVEKGINQII